MEKRQRTMKHWAQECLVLYQEAIDTRSLDILGAQEGYVADSSHGFYEQLYLFGVHDGYFKLLS